jgi:hypothetical protein
VRVVPAEAAASKQAPEVHHCCRSHPASCVRGTAATRRVVTDARVPPHPPTPPRAINVTTCTPASRRAPLPQLDGVGHVKDVCSHGR